MHNGRNDNEIKDDHVNVNKPSSSTPTTPPMIQSTALNNNVNINKLSTFQPINQPQLQSQSQSPTTKHSRNNLHWFDDDNDVNRNPNPFDVNLFSMGMNDNDYNVTNNNDIHIMSDIDLLHDDDMNMANNNNNNNRDHIKTIKSETSDIKFPFAKFSTDYAANFIRPGNLPQFRPQKQFKHETSKTINNNHSHNHILTPFDYPLSNTLIDDDLIINHKQHMYYGQQHVNKNNNNYIHCAPLLKNTNDSMDQEAFKLNYCLLTIPQGLLNNVGGYHVDDKGYLNIDDDDSNDIDYEYDGQDTTDLSDNGNGYNFLWWYPETKFCEIDPNLITK